VSNEQYDRLIETYDKLLELGKIDEFEHQERIDALNNMYAKGPVFHIHEMQEKHNMSTSDIEEMLAEE